jgi:hypothetical protein
MPAAGAKRLRHLPGDVGSFLASQLAQAAKADLFQPGDDGWANPLSASSCWRSCAENGMELLRLYWLASGVWPLPAKRE